MRGSTGPVTDVAGVVLAAGAGTRLSPLTCLRPKALCPVGGVALVDHAVAAVSAAVRDVAVNVHHGRQAMQEHLSATPAVHVSVEQGRALGTAGAIGHLAEWIDGRPALVANADAWHTAELSLLLDDWDGTRPRVLTTSAASFGPRSTVVASLLPGAAVTELAAPAGRDPQPSGLWESVWGSAVQGGRLETAHTDAVFVDCGTVADYLRANLEWLALQDPEVSGDAEVIRASIGADGSTVVDSVVARGAVVAGSVERCVVWDDSSVDAGEHLVNAIRAHDRTVLVR